MESKLSKAQQEAKMYVDKHKLEQLIGEMLNSLVHAKDPFPIIYMIKYLAGLCKEDELAQNGIIVKGNFPQPKPLVKFPVFPDSCNSLVKKHLTREVWDRLKDKRTKLGNDFYSCVRPGIEHPDNEVGLIAVDEDAYTQYEPLFFSVAEDLHSWSRSRKQQSTLGDDISIETLDASVVNTVQVRFARNFEGLPFPPALAKKQRTDVETLATGALTDLGGQYTSLESIRDPLRNRLQTQLVVFEKPGRLYDTTAAGKDWPEGRGIWETGSGVFVKVNDQDHLQVIATSQDGDLKSAYEEAVRVVQTLEQHRPFAKSATIGYLTSSLNDVGCGLALRARLHLQNADPAAVQKWGVDSNVEVNIKEEGFYEVSWEQTLGKTETEAVKTFAERLRQAVALNGEEETPQGNLGNTLVAQVVPGDVRKRLSSQSVLSVNFKDLLVTEEDAEVGLIAKHAQCYTSFNEAFEPVISKLHNFGIPEQNLEAVLEDVDPDGFFIKSLRIRFSRNIAGDVFEPGLNSLQRKVILNKVQTALKDLEGEFIELETASEQQISDLNRYLPFVPTPLGGDYSYTKTDWPQGRGVWVSGDKKVVVWVNYRDHIEIIGQNTGGSFSSIYQRTLETLDVLSSLTFERNSFFGYLTSSPKDIGSAMKLTAFVKAPLAAKKEEFSVWTQNNFVTFRPVVTGDQATQGRLYELATTRKLKPTEGQVLTEFVQTLKTLIEWEQKEQIAKFPEFPVHSQSIVPSLLTPELWERYKSLKTPDWLGFYQNIQADVEIGDLETGLYLASPSSYTTYQEVVDAVVLKLHEYPATGKHSKNLSTDDLTEESLDSQFVLSTRIHVLRNLTAFPLSGGVSRSQRTEIEQILVGVLNSLSEELQGSYQPLISLTGDELDDFAKAGLAIPSPTAAQESAHLARDWPESRGIFSNSDKSFLASVNTSDHLHLVSSGADIKTAFESIVKALQTFEEQVQFSYDDHYGYFTSSLTNIGTALKVSVKVKVPKAVKQPNFKTWCQERHLKAVLDTATSVLEVSNARSVGVSESQCLKDAQKGVSDLIEWEKRLEKS